MIFSHRSLRDTDVSFAAELDSKWFGKSAISELELADTVKYPDKNTALFADDILVGFAIFEVLEATANPSDYRGDFPEHNSVLFLQQFTTESNYEIENMWTDEALLETVELAARTLGCEQVWEALAIDHPYCKEKNPKFDAFGFYIAAGYSIDTNKVVWRPDESININCLLLSKKLS